MKTERTTDVALLILRLIAGLILFYYGAQKLLGVFGGPGFTGTLNGFQTRMGIPPVFGALAIFAEFFGGLGLIVGLLTRVAAVGTLCTMAVATFVSFRNASPLFDPATGANPMKDVGFPLSLLAISLAILLMGAGRISLDFKLFGKGRS